MMRSEEVDQPRIRAVGRQCGRDDRNNENTARGGRVQRSRGGFAWGAGPSAWFGLAALLLAQPVVALPLRLVVIGDSLSAEYDSITGVSGVDDPTEYAAITVPGWESMCWVEALKRLRPDQIDLGQTRDTFPGWTDLDNPLQLDLRFTGSEFNFAVPGFTAAQFEQVVSSSLTSDPQWIYYRLQLESVLKDKADAAVVWLGTNELRSNYGSLYDGLDPFPLINGLSNDLARVVDFVRTQKQAVKLVIANLPDLGATPTKRADHPDPSKRAIASAATMAANDAIAAIAAARGLPVVDIFSDTHRLALGETIWTGPVNLFPGDDPDNHPRFQFTRDGLHPNTCLQTVIARHIVDTFNQAYAESLTPISDGEMLNLIGISFSQTYLDWAATNSLASAAPGEDGDGDGLVNLAEFVFALDPQRPDPGPIAIEGAAGLIRARFQPDPGRMRLVAVDIEWGTTLYGWSPVPSENVSANTAGEITVDLPGDGPARFVRLRVYQRPED